MKTNVGLTVVGFMFIAIVSASPVGAADQTAPTRAQRTEGGKTIDQYRTEALVYKQEADRLSDAAAEYERKAAAISPHQDPKGNMRNSLITAAQEHRTKASKMQELYAANQKMADTMAAQSSE